MTETLAIDSRQVSLWLDGTMETYMSIKKFNRLLFGPDLGYLPAAVRWVSSSPPLSLIFERPPTNVPILGCIVHFPWTLWALSLEGSKVNIRLFFRNSPLMTFNDPVFQAPLPCVAEDGKVQGFDHSIDIEAPLGMQLQSIIDNCLSFISLSDENILLPSLPPMLQSAGDVKEDILETWSGISDYDCLISEYMPSSLSTVQELIDTQVLDTNYLTNEAMFLHFKQILLDAHVPQQNESSDEISAYSDEQGEASDEDLEYFDEQGEASDEDPSENLQAFVS